MAPKAPPMITIAQAAEHLAVDPKTVRRWISLGRLPGYRVGGSRTVRIKAEDVDTLLVPIVGKRGYRRRGA